MIFVSNSPAGPTNGSPRASSTAPGASPMNMSSASGLPTPNTVCVRERARWGHFVQTETGTWICARSLALSPPPQTRFDCTDRFLRRQSAVITTKMSLALSDYDYPLPEELIATRPLPNRQDSRMLVLHRREQRIEHRKFAELAEFLEKNDLLVLNNTRVVNARRFSDDGKIEFLFLEKLEAMRWKCLVRSGLRMRIVT